MFRSGSEAETVNSRLTATDTLTQQQPKNPDPSPSQTTETGETGSSSGIEKRPPPRKSGLEIVRVQGGAFTMGSPANEAGRFDNECQHRVTVGSFSIGKYEVTQADWRNIMGKNPSYFKNCDDCPVEQVSWDDIQDFLKKLNARYPGKNYRLPTEAEWEYAARGGKASSNTYFTPRLVFPCLCLLTKSTQRAMR